MSLILVTNDDGVHAPGLKVLVEAMQAIGQPVVIAPTHDNSAASHSLTMHRPLKATRLEDNIYSIDGTPTDCVSIGIQKILPEPPILVVSGINPGGNLGDDISYSGTVSAAVEGTMLGVPSMAVSLVGEHPFHFNTAATVATRVANFILQHGLPADTLLNVNVPNQPLEAVRELRFTRQGRLQYDGAIKETTDPWGRPHYWIGGGTPSWDNGVDTDSMAVQQGCISITPIHLDLTNHEALIHLRTTWQHLTDMRWIDEKRAIPPE